MSTVRGLGLSSLLWLGACATATTTETEDDEETGTTLPQSGGSTGDGDGDAGTGGRLVVLGSGGGLVGGPSGGASGVGGGGSTGGGENTGGSNTGGSNTGGGSSGGSSSGGSASGGASPGSVAECLFEWEQSPEAATCEEASNSAGVVGCGNALDCWQANDCAPSACSAGPDDVCGQNKVANYTQGFVQANEVYGALCN